VDLFTPNQTEAELLLGLTRTQHVSKKRLIDPKQMGSDLIARGAKTVVLKLGGTGAMVIDGQGQIERVRPFRVKVVDTTAAGDAFTGALAVAYAEGLSLPAAVRFANAAGAVCCQTFGAQPSLPTRQAVEELLAGK
jgi:ribokinase